jgi:hypothetical protein
MTSIVTNIVKGNEIPKNWGAYIPNQYRNGDYKTFSNPKDLITELNS